MLRKLIIVLLLLIIAGSLLTAQELKIAYRYKVSGPDSGNFLTFTGRLRYIETQDDNYDGKTGASTRQPTRFLATYQPDVLGTTAFPAALRNLFLYPAIADTARIDNNLQVNKASNGIITIQFVHCGVAYGILTDTAGKINLGPSGPVGSTHIYQRTIGYIKGAGPQILHADFSSDGTAAKVDYGKVWNTGVSSRKNIGGTLNKTGPRIVDGPDPSSLFYWSGTLQVSFDGGILRISGILKAHKR